MANNKSYDWLMHWMCMPAADAVRLFFQPVTWLIQRWRRQ